VLIGLGQALGWDYSPFLSDARSQVRGTLGRANYLGAYLAMLLPLTLALGFLLRPGVGRLLVGTLVLGEAVVLVLTVSRAAWLGVGVALATFALLWLWPRLGPRWGLAALGGVALVLGGGLGTALWLGREGGSTAARSAIWQASLQLVGERPLLGFGPDAFGLVFTRVFPPELVYFQGRGTLVDRAHNLPLDWLTAAGGIGAVAWLLLLALVFIVGVRALRAQTGREQRLILVASLAALAANTAGNLVAFDVTTTATLTWLLFALVVATATQPPACPVLAVGWQGVGWPRAVLAALVVAASLGAALLVGVAPALADMEARVAAEHGAARRWQAAMGAAERAVTLWPYEPSFHQALSWTYLQQTRDGGTAEATWFARAEGALLAGRELRPLDFRVWWSLGELYTVWGGRLDRSAYTKAEAAFSRAAELAPNHGGLYVSWGILELEAGRTAEASAKFERALALDATDANAHSRLGDALLLQARAQEAADSFGRAVKLDPGLLAGQVGLARANLILGRAVSAREALDSASRIAPDNPAVIALRQQMGLRP
jgi:hypothetical protein